MKRFSKLTMATIALLCLTFALPSGNAIGQTKITKDQLVGTWSYVSVVVTRPDGSKLEPFGPKPTGTLIFTANGRYSLQLIKADLPKFASKDRLKGTPEENTAMAQGLLSHFGTFTVNEAEGTYTLHVEVSSFAGDNGGNQVRKVTSFSADELTIGNPTPTTAGTAVAVFKRVK